MTEAAYSEYPLTLAHPHFAASKPIPVPGSQIYDNQGKLLRQDFHGTPQRYPPVTVNSVDEEERMRADGYERAGKVDPSAWVRAHADAPPADYTPQKYPMWRDGQLIMTAQEDPGAAPEELAPKSVTAEPELVAEPTATEAENLRAQMAEMMTTMQTMLATTKTLAEENAKLKAEKETPPEVSETPADAPRHKRTYNKRT